MIGEPIEGHKNFEYYKIGIIDFTDISSITEEQIQDNRRFNPKSIGQCKINVYPNEGPIPHFHIFNKDKTFESCIRIYENMYFSHGGKYKDTLNPKQCRQLNEYLKSPSPRLEKITLWEEIMLYWENATTYNYPKKCKTQPHYENMTLFRDVI